MGWYPHQQRADFDASTAAASDFVTGLGTGYRLARGTTTLDGSSGTSVATGLAGVVAAGVERQSSAFSTGDPITYTVQYTTSTGNLSVYPWFASSSASNALAESTSTGTISWWAIGV